MQSHSPIFLSVRERNNKVYVATFWLAGVVLLYVGSNARIWSEGTKNNGMCFKDLFIFGKVSLGNTFPVSFSKKEVCKKHFSHYQPNLSTKLCISE